MRKPSRTAVAIVMVCLSSLCFTLNDTVTKFLIERYEVTVIIFVRGVLAMPLLVAMAVTLGRTRVRWSPALWLYALRGALGLLAAYMYIEALKYLSIAEATVIVFASPFIVTLASVLVFHERPGWRTWAAVLVSFGGVVIAIQPGASAFQPASLLILACAFLYAAISLTSRWLPGEDNLWTVSLYGAAFSALYVAPFTAGNWTALDPGDLILFAAAAFFSSLGIGLGSLAYRSAPASTLAPFGYIGLLWSTGVTWIVWDTVPGAWTLTGAAVVASSSLFYLMSRQPPADRD
ncbi:DMT family transporter [Albidovulum sp.]|uniref:DMT family transporter n=2 Tax=Albidovulum sp. TaxID=1872424 RepID=UPI003052AB11